GRRPRPASARDPVLEEISFLCSGSTMKIAYLIHNIYGIGGTNRTVINQASALRHRHDVEIVSVFRHRDHPVLPIPPGVTVTSLVHARLPPGEGVGVQGRRLHEGEERAGLPPEVFPGRRPASGSTACSPTTGCATTWPVPTP